jgi:AcrR family transcriptional regulator
MAEPTPAVRGRKAVESALIQAAADLLAEVGPRGATVRAIATRAGVNHGQVHHYFGSRDGLIRAAMRELATEHFKNAMERARGHDVPPALSLAADERYWRAVVRLSVDGELGLARIEVDEGVSVPRRALEVLARRRGLDRPDVDTKAMLAATAALQLGWVALERFMFILADVAPEEEDAVRSRIREIATELFQAEPPSAPT